MVVPSDGRTLWRAFSEPKVQNQQEWPAKKWLGILNFDRRLIPILSSRVRFLLVAKLWRFSLSSSREGYRFWYLTHSSPHGSLHTVSHTAASSSTRCISALSFWGVLGSSSPEPSSAPGTVFFLGSTFFRCCDLFEPEIQTQNETHAQRLIYGSTWTISNRVPFFCSLRFLRHRKALPVRVQHFVYHTMTRMPI